MSTFSVTSNELSALKSYAEYLFIANIVEFFDKYGETAAQYSNFKKEAYKLHQMVKDKKPANEINAFAEKLKKEVPLSYSDMRDMFG